MLTPAFAAPSASGWIGLWSPGCSDPHQAGWLIVVAYLGRTTLLPRLPVGGVGKLPEALTIRGYLLGNTSPLHTCAQRAGRYVYHDHAPCWHREIEAPRQVCPP